MTPHIVLVYITVRDKDQARTIGRTLVVEKLAACANIVDGMNSFYVWKGELCDDHETVLIVKTRKTLLGPLIRRVKQLHSYDVPCIVAVPVVGGNPEFLRWVMDETAPRKGGQKSRKAKTGKP